MKNNPDFDPKVLERLLIKLKSIIRQEIGEDRAPFDLDLFGFRCGHVSFLYLFSAPTQ